MATRRNTGGSRGGNSGIRGSSVPEWPRSFRLRLGCMLSWLRLPRETRMRLAGLQGKGRERPLHKGRCKFFAFETYLLSVNPCYRVHAFLLPQVCSLKPIQLIKSK